MVGAALPWRFCRSAHVQTRLLAAGHSCCQKVAHRFSGSEQDVLCWVPGGWQKGEAAGSESLIRSNAFLFQCGKSLLKHFI